jgi:undecaprenyl-diphosphatase
LFADVIETRLRSPLVVAVTLTIGAIGLIAAERIGRKTRDARSLGYGEAMLIGIAQAAALAPGISRSGATLTMSLFLNVRRESAARFVFLMSLPAIVAAAAKEALDVSEAGMAGAPVTLLAVGLVVSAIVGYVTIKFFVRYLASHSLEVFAYYRFALAAVTVVWLLTR